MYRSDQAIESCRAHLNKTCSDDPQISSILAAYVSNVIYAEAESKIVEIVAAFAQGDSEHSHIESYCKKSAKKIVRSIKISEMSGTAGIFSGDCKAKFTEQLDPSDKNAWDAIVQNRHGHAHESDRVVISDLTFSDVENYFRSVKNVLACFSDALSIEH